MYIWILLATFMIALSFLNLSPRQDKQSVFSEITEADYTEFMETQKLSMQEKAVQSGLLEDLYADVSEKIENLVYDDKAVKEYYKVVIISS